MVWKTIEREPWSPLREMGRLHDELQRFFGQALVEGRSTYPRLNVRASEDAVLVTAELPGLAPADVELEVHDDTLTLKGERKAAEPAEGERAYRTERFHGRFQRVLTLPFRVAADGVTARFRDGLLEVELPRSEEDKVRRIPVSTD